VRGLFLTGLLPRTIGKRGRDLYTDKQEAQEEGLAIQVCGRAVLAPASSSADCPMSTLDTFLRAEVQSTPLPQAWGHRVRNSFAPLLL
jgi:hypothetical protein